MKAIDIVKSPPKTEHEAWNRWLNRMQADLAQAPWTKRKRIEVK